MQMKAGDIMKKELPEYVVEILNETEEGKKYLEYNEKIGGERFGYGVGMPDIDEKYGGEIGLYDECIKRGITWEELLNYPKYDPDVII